MTLSVPIPLVLIPRVLISGLVLGACATGTVGLDRETAPRSGVQLDLVRHGDADATRTFPALVAAQLPGADGLATEIRTELGQTASLEVHLCVAPGGTVRSIEVTRSSNLPAFDQAVVTDARHWQFAALPGPAELRTCERATITYRPRA